ncbi:condensation domain-containing protein [Streptomyces sp. NRRL F-5630]|uniref:condensation domain-containing protein n=1 Tax=Streptomyces sp. NRRL F-5630 TaxID=1463864 RepID=UPI0004CA171F|nr:condensation domain-containing protein [Streptomyces sp. NRRL F-5630]
MTRPGPVVHGGGPAPGGTAGPVTVPATYAQERAWLASRLAHDPPTYCAVDEFPLHAAVSADDLVHALHVLMDRHEPLRTVLRTVDGRLCQEVHPSPAPRIAVIDLSAQEPAAQAEERRSLRARLARTPFDPRRAPQWRAAVLDLGEGAWSVLFAAHHTVYDTASGFNVHAELTELCAAAEEGRPPRLPHLPFGYGEYARRERERAGSDSGEAAAAHWRTRMRGLPPVHTVPLDRSRPPARTFRGAEVRTALPVGVTATLTDAARHHGTRPVLLLLAAWSALLHHHSGADDLAVGLPVAGRDDPATRAMVGTFVNMRVLRADLSGDPDGTEVIRRTAAAVRAGERFDIPFQRLVALLGAPRLPGVPPLYQLAFNHTPADGLGPPVVSCEEDLLLDIAGTGVRLIYDAALFDRSTADALLADYMRLLAPLLDAPGPRLSALLPGTAPRRAHPPAPAPPPARTAPRDATEERVAAVWRTVLGTDAVDVHEDFFAAGGHSLQALRLLARLAPGREDGPTLRTFFADPTVAGLATALKSTLDGRTPWR